MSKTKTKRRRQRGRSSSSRRRRKTVRRQPLGVCPHCGTICHCSRSKKHKGGSAFSGCGSCGCPLAPMSWSQMNQFGGGGGYTRFSQPVIPSSSASNPDRYSPILGIGQNGGKKQRQRQRQRGCGLTGGNCGCGAPLFGGGCGCDGFQGQDGGGSFYKPPAPIPGPFVGSPWGAQVNQWPGVNGVGADRNYLSSYAPVIANDPQQQLSMNDAGYLTRNSMVGGRRRRKTCKRGGQLIPQDLVNVGRNVAFQAQSALNALKGVNPPVDPAPYKGQLTGALNSNSLVV